MQGSACGTEALLLLCIGGGLPRKMGRGVQGRMQDTLGRGSGVGRVGGQQLREKGHVSTHWGQRGSYLAGTL